MNDGRSTYKADLTAGSLKVAESRVIAKLLLENASDEKWRQALIEDNQLQARSPATAQRLARLIRNRLETMTPDLWKLVKNGSSTVATHACLAAAVKHSVLLADFLDLVVREQYQIFAEKLTHQHWHDFVAECQNRDPDLSQWSESTIKRLRSSVLQILQQAGYIDNTSSLRLQPQQHPDLRWANNGGESVLQLGPSSGGPGWPVGRGRL